MNTPCNLHCAHPWRLENGEEMLPYLKSDTDVLEPDKLLRSPDDGEEFVVIWGVDFSQLAQAGHSSSVVYAYERNGTKGKRWVMKGPSSVLQMTNEELRKEPFPPGHEPPS